MKWMIPLLFMLSCGPSHKRNAEIITTYEGIVEHHVNPSYNTEAELRKSLSDEKGPDFILFSAEWCPPCRTLKETIMGLGWRDKILILDLDQKWVKFVAETVGVEGVPAMIVTYDAGGVNSKLITGAGEIGKVLFEQLEMKK
jgi:thiol-disulfide isomerase/thioredoxin